MVSVPLEVLNIALQFSALVFRAHLMILILMMLIFGVKYVSCHILVIFLLRKKKNFDVNCKEFTRL